MIPFTEALQKASEALGGDAELAQVLYTSETELAEWRSGLARPTRAVVLALAELLQLST